MICSANRAARALCEGDEEIAPPPLPPEFGTKLKLKAPIGIALAPPPPPLPPANPMACKKFAIPDCFAAENGMPLAAAAARAAALRCRLDSEPVDENEAKELAE